MSWPCRGTGGDHYWESREAGRGGSSVSCASCYECVNSLSTVRERDKLRAENEQLRGELREEREERGVAMAMRNNERTRIVAYVRALSGRSETDDSWNGEQCHGIANAIERGEHMR